MRHLTGLVVVVAVGLVGCSDDEAPKDAPDTVLDSSPKALTNQPKVTFTFHAAGNANGFVCSVDGGAPSPCLSGIEITVGEGSHTFEVSASLGLAVDETPAVATWKVDLTPPETQMLMGPPALDNTVMPALEFSGSDPGGGPVTYECKLDAATYATCTSPSSFGVTDGLHTFSARAVDAAGNADPTPANHEWTVDSSTPDTMITLGPTGGSTTTPDVTFTFGSPASGVLFECSLDGAAFVPCTAPQTFEDLPDGMHTFTVRAKTAAGTMDPSPATRTWTVDGTAPTVTLTAQPANPSSDSTPTFSFTSNDATARFECSIDSGAFVACTSAFTSAALADGMHTFRVRAKDPVGNTSTVVTYSWVIDTMAPTVTITAGPSGMVASPNASFTFTTAGSPTVTECALDAGAFAACTSPRAFTALADGAHTFTVRVRDAAGNTGMDLRTFTVDTTAPTVMITAAPTNPTSDNTPTFSFSTAGAPTLVQCAMDGGAFATCTSPHTTAVLADGSHTFVVRATDAVGNTASDARTFSIDTAAPTVTIDTRPSNPSNSASAAFTFTVSEGSPQCSIDGGAFAACTSPRNYTGLANGSHTFTVRSADALGNTGMASYTWTIDTTVPVVTILSGPTGTTNASTASFTFTVSEGSPQCQLDSGAFAACTSPRSYTGLAAGSHTFTVRSTDAAGNVGTASRTWTIDTTLPVVTIVTRPANPTNATTATFTFTVSEGSVECQLDTGAFSVCSSPRSYTGLTAGNHTFTVRATDAAGNVGSASYTWTIDLTPPTVTINTRPNNPTNLTTATFTFTASDGTTECQIDGGLFTACTSPRSYTGLAAGSHTFVVRATDAAGNPGSATYTWTIDTTAPTVTINTSPSNPTNLTTAAFTFTVSDGTIQCQLDGGGFTACTSPRTYTGLTPGSHTFIVRSTDAAGNVGSDTRTWTIDTAGPTVTIVNRPNNPTNQTTATFTFTVSEGSPQCQIDGGGFTACTSPRSYTGLAAGSHTFVVRSTDSAGNPGSATYTWTIDLTPPTITIMGPPSPTANRNPSISFTVSEGSPQCRLDTASFAACTSPVSYTNLADGSHTFSVTATDAAGNPATANHTWTIDGTGPIITFSSVPPARWPVNYYDFAWSANESAQYECSVNGGTSWVACSTPFAIPNAAAMLPAASYGVSNTFSVRGRDSLNNVGAASTHTWTPVAGVVLHYPFEQGLRQNTSLLAQRPAYSPGVSGQGAAVGGWAGTAIRNPASATYAGARRPLSSSAQGVYMGGMWIRVFNDQATGTLWSNIDAGNLWGHSVSISSTTLTLRVLQNGTPFTVTAQVPFNQWAHVGVRTTGAAKGLELTVNGANAAHARPPSATGFDGGQGDLRIGQLAFVDVDDVRFYNTLVDTCTTFVRGQIPPTGGPCVAGSPALEMDFEGGRLDQTGTMLIGRSLPLWTAFTGRLGDGFKLASPQVPLEFENFAQNGRLAGHSFSVWVPGSAVADTVFDFVRACPAVTFVGNCGMRVSWTANRQFAIFAGHAGSGPTGSHQQSIVVPASGSLDATRTHSLVIAETRGTSTRTLKFYVDGRLEGTLTFSGDVFALGNDAVRSCSVAGCSFDEMEVWPMDLSANAEMLCENGFDGEWDPAADRCRFTSND